MPQLIIQSMNNQFTQKWTSAGIFSITLSVFMTLNGLYRYGYYLLWLGMALKDVPNPVLFIGQADDHEASEHVVSGSDGVTDEPEDEEGRARRGLGERQGSQRLRNIKDEVDYVRTRLFGRDKGPARKAAFEFLDKESRRNPAVKEILERAKLDVPNKLEHIDLRTIKELKSAVGFEKISKFMQILYLFDNDDLHPDNIATSPADERKVDFINTAHDARPNSPVVGDENEKMSMRMKRFATVQKRSLQRGREARSLSSPLPLIQSSSSASKPPR